jgi:hypothetical protein
MPSKEAKKPKKAKKKANRAVDPTSVRANRRFFLQIASEHPEIPLLETLHEQVFRNEGDELDSALRKWASNWNLEYAWVLATARFLYDISRSPETNQVREDFGFDRFIPAYEISPFRVPPWAPNEKPEVYWTRIMRDFRKFLREWIDGCKESRRRLSPDRGRRRRAHYRWAAEWACLRWTLSHIAKNESERPDARPAGLFLQAIHKAIKAVFIELDTPFPLKMPQKDAR